jgi:hypothetical protein
MAKTVRRKRQYVILSSSEDSKTPGPQPERAPVPRSLDEIALANWSKTRRALIAEAAYFRASCRGFRGGSNLEDWLAAEAEIDAMLEATKRR